jgi:hypothetical protein
LANLALASEEVCPLFESRSLVESLESVVTAALLCVLHRSRDRLFDLIGWSCTRGDKSHYEDCGSDFHPERTHGFPHFISNLTFDTVEAQANVP